MKYVVQETRSSLIKNYVFANNDVTMQWLPLSEKFVHKANWLDQKFPSSCLAGAASKLWKVCLPHIACVYTL